MRRVVLLGTGVIADERTVNAMSREGNRRAPSRYPLPPSLPTLAAHLAAHMVSSATGAGAAVTATQTRGRSEVRQLAGVLLGCGWVPH